MDAQEGRTRRPHKKYVGLQLSEVGKQSTGPFRPPAFFFVTRPADATLRQTRGVAGSLSRYSTLALASQRHGVTVGYGLAAATHPRTRSHNIAAGPWTGPMCPVRHPGLDYNKGQGLRSTRAPVPRGECLENRPRPWDNPLDAPRRALE